MRVLHLLDPGTERGGAGETGAGVGGTLACAAAIQNTPEADHLVCIIGTRTSRRCADLAGIDDAVIVPGALGVPEGARSRIASVADAFAPNVVQCWSLASASAANLSVPRTPRSVGLVGTPSETPAWKRRLRLRALQGCACHAFGSDAQGWHDEMKAAGLSATVETLPHPAAAIRVAPAPDPDPAEHGVACVTDPGGLMSAQRAAAMLCLHAASERTFALRISRDANQTGRARRMITDTGRDFSFAIVDGAMLGTIDGASLGVWGPVAVGDQARESSGRQGIVWGSLARAGIPMIARRNAVLEALMPADLHNSLLTDDGDALGLCSRVHGLVSRRGLIGETGERLRTDEGTEQRNSRFAASLVDVWRRLTPAWSERTRSSA